MYLQVNYKVQEIEEVFQAERRLPNRDLLPRMSRLIARSTDKFHTSPQFRANNLTELFPAHKDDQRILVRQYLAESTEYIHLIANSMALRQLRMGATSSINRICSDEIDTSETESNLESDFKKSKLIMESPLYYPILLYYYGEGKSS